LLIIEGAHVTCRMKSLATRGSLKVDEMQLSLLKESGEVIATAPITSIKLRSNWYTNNTSIQIRLNGQKCSVNFVDPRTSLSTVIFFQFRNLSYAKRSIRALMDEVSRLRMAPEE
jgi:hypothetical protein